MSEEDEKVYTAFANGFWADGRVHDSFTMDELTLREGEAWATDYLLSRFSLGGTWTTGVYDRDGNEVFTLRVVDGKLVEVFGYVPEYAKEDA